MAAGSLKQKAIAAAAKTKGGWGAATAAAKQTVALAEGIVEAVDSAVELVTGVPSSQQQIIDGLNQSINASNAAAAAANAAEDAASSCACFEPGSFGYEQLGAAVYMLKQALGYVEFGNPQAGMNNQTLRNLIEIFNMAQSARTEAMNADQSVQQLSEYVEAISRNLGHYSMDAAGRAALAADTLSGNTAGSNLIILRKDEETERWVPAINPLYLTFQSPSGDSTFGLLENLSMLMARVYYP